MRYSDLTEAFDSPYDLKWDLANNANWRARFSSKNKEYVVNFYREDDDTYVKPDGSFVEGIWEVMFYADGSVDREYGVTGGVEDVSKVFATVIKAIEHFVDKARPSAFMFNSKEGETSRAKLYSRMIDRLAPQIGKDYRGESLEVHPDLVGDEDEMYAIHAWVRK